MAWWPAQSKVKVTIMKFRSKIVLAYTTVALLVSLILGIAVARISLQYEMTSQKNNLRVTAKSYVA